MKITSSSRSLPAHSLVSHNIGCPSDLPVLFMMRPVMVETGFEELSECGLGDEGNTELIACTRAGACELSGEPSQPNDR